MLGAIIGDVAGSYYEVLEVQEVKQKRKRSYEERIKILDKKTPLFQENSSCTDDSFLTYSIYDAIMITVLWYMILFWHNTAVI